MNFKTNQFNADYENDPEVLKGVISDCIETIGHLTAKPTGGKWKVVFGNESIDVRTAFVYVERPQTEYTKANPDICQVFAVGDDGREGGEMEANAYLIATAPELLEACKAIFNALTVEGKIAVELEKHLRASDKRTILGLKDVIAKAEGGK